MNLALIITRHNIAEITKFCEEAEPLQKSEINGAIAICWAKGVPAAEVRRITAGLASKFKATRGIEQSINSSYGKDGQASAILSAFCIGAYGRFPGPWLIIDGYCRVTKENWVEQAFKSHAQLGRKSSGMALIEKAGPLTIGPVIIGMDMKSMALIISYANTSWRERARYAMMRNGLGIMGDEWPFSLTGKIKEAEIVSTHVDKPVEDTRTNDQKFDDFMKHLSTLNDEELANVFQREVGRKPHPKMSRQKIVDGIIMEKTEFAL